MKFQDITLSDDLKSYLNAKSRLSNCDYLSHYTNYDNLLHILNSKKFYLSKADGMNDQLEFQNGDRSIWDKLYFFSMIMNRKENIGMWSVYSQPWKDGIKLSFPTDAVQAWLSDTNKFYVVDEDEKINANPLRICDSLELFLSAVAYTNTDSKDSKDEEEIIRWNTVSNSNIVSASRIAGLTGYIKDMAWSYEQEIRIKALFQKPVNFHRIALDISNLMEKMTITTGPLFKGSIQQRLQEDLEEFDEFQYHFAQSIFTNRFRM